ncbi:hypothetical protein JHN63_43705 [Streptomyces sp. MBT65]|uniref:hypothetical protein n=1 Tax=Streptomyces sp. MBT65 TaxID=1488395 RepID=UPI00190A58E4|nr:hypothetical protein [Streptomyces sp. MBT65]MBK3580577.1 hypothetical protein [Streptomyces sp. MBT65]
MKRSPGIRLCVTVAVSALSLALITGCSDGGSDDAKSNDGKSNAEDTAKNSAKALSAAELTKLAIAKGDVVGYEVGAVGKTYPASKSAVTVDKAQCRPLAWAMAGQAPGDAAAATNKLVTEAKKTSATPSKSVEDMSEQEFDDAFGAALDRTTTVVGLSSYDGDGAEKTFKTISDAVKSCAGGFTLVPGSDGTKYTKVAAEKASNTGDESVAFGATAVMEDTDGQTGTVHTEVVRHGSTLVTYYTVNLGALMSQKAYTIPSVVIDAQSAKLK